MTPVIELRAARKAYGDLEVLHGVDITIEPGELTAIVGPSGSGKTTVLQLMGTLDRPTSGTVSIAGVDTATMADAQLAALRARTIGFVFQQFFLLEGMSAVENTSNGLLYGGVSRDDRLRRAAEVLERVGLGHRLGHTPAELSGGEKQRVAIARALLARPAVVLADEPTGNLDSENGRGVLALLRDLNDDGTTIVVVTHDHEVAAATDRQVVLRDGSVVADDRGEVIAHVGGDAHPQPSPAW